MSGLPGRSQSPAFKAKVALAAIPGDRTMSELALLFDALANQIKPWKDHILAHLGDVFDDAVKKEWGPAINVTARRVWNGRLTQENDFGRCARGGRPVAGGKTMTDRGHKLSLSRQAALLGIGRQPCDEPHPVSAADLKRMRRIDDLDLDLPFAGVRTLVDLLR